MDGEGATNDDNSRYATYNVTLDQLVDCRPKCGACCIAPSITSPIPGMPRGKPAGVPCVQLTLDYRCSIFNDPRRPAVCAALRPILDMCGESQEQALSWLEALDQATSPNAESGQPDLRE